MKQLIRILRSRKGVWAVGRAAWLRCLGYQRRTQQPTAFKILVEPAVSHGAVVTAQNAIGTVLPVGGSHIAIFESELRVMGTQALQRGNLEIGWSLHGLWTHGGRAVIYLAVPAGPKSIFSATSFLFDLEHFSRVYRQLVTGYGLQWLGDCHSHHRLGLTTPSSTDQAHIQAVAGKNSLPRLVQMIITFRSPDCSSQSATVSKSPQVHIHGYHYPNAADGRYMECPIRTIPGTSPFRQVLAGTTLLNPEMILTEQLVMDGINFDTQPLKPKGDECHVDE